MRDGPKRAPNNHTAGQQRKGPKEDYLTCPYGDMSCCEDSQEVKLPDVSSGAWLERISLLWHHEPPRPSGC